MYKGQRIIALCISRTYEHTDYISELNRLLTEKGYQLLIYQTCSDLYWGNEAEKVEKVVFELIDYTIVDAVILFATSFYDKEVVQKIKTQADEHGKPLVIMGDDDENYMSFMLDHKKGFEMVVRHVMEYHEIRDVHFIAGVKNEINSEERLAVFKKVLSENAIAFSEDMVSYGDYWQGPTVKAVAALLERDHLPGAIICANDSMAVIVCEELGKRGVSVPQDVLVSGFDGTKDAEYNIPSITTSKYNLTLLLEKTVESIDAALLGQDRTGVSFIEYSLMPNGSCGCEQASPIINYGYLLRDASDRFYSYLEHERTLHELLENSVMNVNSAELIKSLKQLKSSNMLIAINKSCFDSSMNPVDGKKQKNFEKKMCLVYDSVNEGIPLPYEYEASALPRLLDRLIADENPTLFVSLGFMGIPFGYMVWNTEISTYEYNRIFQYETTINTLIGCNQNVRYIQYISRQMEELSKQDYLTEFYTQNGFFEVLDILFGKNAIERYVAVVSVDINGLDSINDNYGHESGDFALQSVAEAISNIYYEHKICARFGGDELLACVMLEKVEEAEQMIKDDIQGYLDSVNDTAGKDFTISASVGIYICEAERFSFNVAYRLAVAKMQEEKLALRTKDMHK